MGGETGKPHLITCGPNKELYCNKAGHLVFSRRWHPFDLRKSKSSPIHHMTGRQAGAHDTSPRRERAYRKKRFPLRGGAESSGGARRARRDVQPRAAVRSGAARELARCAPRLSLAPAFTLRRAPPPCGRPLCPSSAAPERAARPVGRRSRAALAGPGERGL